MIGNVVACILYDTATIVIKKYVSYYTREQVYTYIKVVNTGSENNSIISVNVEKETYNNIMIYMYRRLAPPKETMTVYPTGPTERRDEDINVIIGHSNNNNNIT